MFEHIYFTGGRMSKRTAAIKGQTVFVNHHLVRVIFLSKDDYLGDDGKHYMFKVVGGWQLKDLPKTGEELLFGKNAEEGDTKINSNGTYRFQPNPDNDYKLEWVLIAGPRKPENTLSPAKRSGYGFRGSSQTGR